MEQGWRGDLPGIAANALWCVQARVEGRALPNAESLTSGRHPSGLAVRIDREPCVSVSRLGPAPSEPVGFGGEQLPVVSLNCGNGVQDAGPDSDATGAGACETPVADDHRRSAEICCHLRHGPVVDCHVDPPIAPRERNDVSGYRGPGISVRSTVRSTDCAGT